ncbi:hypothetical protein [Serratia odorifera]|uniref:hypothetical protein n=1 Tax=Serratia odorifera TaxID=618 RepID=UPI000FDC44A9|nr:hypothetical protein [Serratia odorifera]
MARRALPAPTPSRRDGDDGNAGGGQGDLRAGSSLILTVTLKDAQGNPAPGQAGTLTAETVKAANAELKGSWAETGTAGTYSATYTAKTAGTGLKANLKLGSVTAATPALTPSRRVR